MNQKNPNVKVVSSDTVVKGKATIVRGGAVVWVGTLLQVIEVVKDGDYIALHPETFAEQQALHNARKGRKKH